MERSRPYPATTTLSVLTVFLLVGLGVLVFPSAGATEELEATHCFAGTFAAFQGSQELKFLFTWSDHGIVRSPNKLFNNAATHCTGVQRDVGATREGYGLCKMVDADGDIVVFGDHYAGLKTNQRFLEGTGKWKGITGGFESERVANAPKSAMPTSYHTCTQWKGQFEVRK